MGGTGTAGAGGMKIQLNIQRKHFSSQRAIHNSIEISGCHQKKELFVI